MWGTDSFFAKTKIGRQSLVIVLFAMHAVLVGGLFSRIAEVQQALSLSATQFGYALVGLPIGSLFCSLFAGKLIDRLGTKHIIGWCLPISALSVYALASSFNYWTLGLGIAVFALFSVTANIAFNLEADRLEADGDGPVMNKCHGYWALTFLGISLLSALLIKLGISPAQQFFAMMIFAVVITGFAVSVQRQAPRRKTDGVHRKSTLTLPNMSSLLILGFALSGLVMEWATRSWGVIFARDMFQTTDAAAAMILPGLVAAQTIARFWADRWIARFGRIQVVTTMLLATLIGLLCIGLSPNVQTAYIGFALVGFGMAVTQPLSMSLAAQAPGQSASENMAAFSLLQTILVFILPFGFGYLAQEFGLRFAFLILITMPIISFVFTRHIYRKQTFSTK